MGILRGVFSSFWSKLPNPFGLRVGAVTFPPFVLGDEGIDPWLRNFWDVEGVGVNGVGGWERLAAGRGFPFTISGTVVAEGRRAMGRCFERWVGKGLRWRVAAVGG